MRRRLTIIGFLLLIFALSTYGLDRQPPPWFDEGWVLSLARNWVELGHYGHLLQGEPVPSTILNAGFPVILPIALSFRFLGLGIWQGRIPSVLFLVLTCSLVYHLSYRLYGHRVGLWTLVFVFLSPMYADLHPLVMGRQALGEISGTCYLLAGYAAFYYAWGRHKYLIPISSLLFSLALQAKPQFLPFFFLSMFIPLVLLLLKRQKQYQQIVILILLALVFGQLMSWGWSFVARPLVSSNTSSGDPYAMVWDLSVFFTYVVVLKPFFRLTVLRHFLITLAGAPVVVGLVYYGIKYIPSILRNSRWNREQISVFTLWVFSFSWFCWFVFFSIGFLRYLFPGLLIGNILAGYAIYALTMKLDFGVMLQTLAFNIHARSINGISVLRFFVLVLLVIVFVTTLRSFNGIIGVSHQNPYTDVLEFLNTQTDPNALIETYESELFLFLDRPYHYPPDYIQHVLNRRFFLGEDLPLTYDPTEYGIDYLVIGWSKFWGLYDTLLASGNFELAYQNSRYHVYQRIGAENSR